MPGERGLSCSCACPLELSHFSLHPQAHVPTQLSWQLEDAWCVPWPDAAARVIGCRARLCANTGSAIPDWDRVS